MHYSPRPAKVRVRRCKGGLGNMCWLCNVRWHWLVALASAAHASAALASAGSVHVGAGSAVALGRSIRSFYAASIMLARPEGGSPGTASIKITLAMARIDTGAPNTCLSSARAARAGVAVDGARESGSARCGRRSRARQAARDRDISNDRDVMQMQSQRAWFRMQAVDVLFRENRAHLTAQLASFVLVSRRQRV